MHRIKKLLGILCILGIVFFIICDEKGIKIEFQDGKLVFNGVEKIKENIEEKVVDPNAVYKNSDLIHINYEFENPKTLRESDGLDPDFRQVIYKNSSRIKIYSGFENPITLRNSDGMDPEYVAKIEKEKAELDARNESMKYKGPNIISMNGSDITSNIKQTGDKPDNEVKISKFVGYVHNINLNKAKGNSESSVVDLNDNADTNTEVGYFLSNVDEEENEPNVRDVLGDVEKLNNEYPISETKEDDIREDKTSSGLESDLLIENQEEKNEVQDEEDEVQNRENDNTESEDELNISNNNVVENVIEETEINQEDNTEKITDVIKNNANSMEQGGKYTNKILNKVNEEVNSKIKENNKSDVEDGGNSSKVDEEVIPSTKEENNVVQVKVYHPKKHKLNIRKGIKIVHEFIVPEKLDVKKDNSGDEDEGISQTFLEDIISSDEIDINTLESENDEFLQAIFEKTKDTKVMNLIVETYLSEYQFVKAKKFIESLSGTYLDELDPLLNLKVVFNSFALTSKTTDSTLTSIIEDYKTKNLISVEDRLRYLGVISLMKQDYDHFFELANNFTLESHKDFASKLQGYKDQISKQMGMPEYYFDTLVALELFNQGLFQPAKVLALYSLQQNSNYILPYQILAYANFLTNSRDTSIEYLKKLVDIDPNNAEKYRFLMGIAYYRDDKYEQSVVMLSLVKKQSLRTDAERYLIRDYIYLDQKTRLISIWNKILGYDNLVASDFYTYFYEAFYRPFAEGSSYQVFAYDSELANKMIRVCSMKLSDEEKAVCNYGMIGKNVALGQYEGLEESLLKLATEYPQGYLYQALGEYYIQQGDLDKAKAYLLKAVSMTKRTSEVVQIKKLLQDTM